MTRQAKQKVISFNQFLQQQEFFVDELRSNKIIIYPTDTIYGIGAIATPENKQRINQIKQRPANQLLSVIAPNEQRIRDNYQTDSIEQTLSNENLQHYLEKYHGVTFIISREKSAVRLIKHPIQKFVQQLQQPLVSTSVNTTGNNNCTHIDDIDPTILPHIDYIIDNGPLTGQPSVMVNLVTGEIIKR